MGVMSLQLLIPLRQLAVRVAMNNVTLYYNCEEFSSVEVRRIPKKLVFDTASTLYIGQAGPLLARQYEDIFKPKFSPKSPKFYSTSRVADFSFLVMGDRDKVAAALLSHLRFLYLESPALLENEIWSRGKLQKENMQEPQSGNTLILVESQFPSVLFIIH
ncbi:uncharacterized protein CEXT_27691 [Caerostris extrusa]|uniref:Uncharacterized protein n=1 Tax=Caerostris extrusa TaxID=172846 RepID=A0AAV4YE16_CAEEX|nr:uncharacterized protein CEXT_27691 [Caerostris extrusa]